MAAETGVQIVTEEVEKQPNDGSVSVKQVGDNGGTHDALSETIGDERPKPLISKQPLSVQVPETKQVGLTIAELIGRLDNLKRQERFTTHEGQVDVVSLRNSDEFKQILEQFLELKHRLAQDVQSQEQGANLKRNLENLESKIDQVLESAWLAEIRNNQESVWRQELENINSLEEVSRLFTTLEEKAQELYDQYFGSEATHHITQWTLKQCELLKKLEFKLKAGRNPIQTVVENLLRDQLEKRRLEEIRSVLEKLNNKVSNVNSLVAAIRKNLKNELGEDPEAAIIKQTEAVRLSVRRDREPTPPPDDVEGLTNSSGEVVKLAEALNVESEVVGVISALDRLEDLEVSSLNVSDVEIIRNDSSKEAILTTKDGREFKVTAGAVLLGLVLLILSGDEVASIVAKELSEEISRWAMVKLNIPEEIINEVINRGDVAADFIKRLSTDNLLREFTQNMSRRELFNFLKSMDEDQREKMFNGERFDDYTSATDHRRFKENEIKEILERLSESERKELDLAEAYQKVVSSRS